MNILTSITGLRLRFDSAGAQRVVRRTWGTAATFAAAGLGGEAAQALGVYNGLLIGAMSASFAFCRLCKEADVIPFSLQYVQIVVGLALGNLFVGHNALVSDHVLEASAALVVCLVVQVSGSFLWLNRVAKWSTVDALLASYPGAMAAVLDLFDRESASPKVILVHIMRLLVLTVAASLLVQGPASAVAAGAAGAGGVALALAVVVVPGVVLGAIVERLGVPAPYMLVSLLLSGAAVHSGFVTGFDVPQLAMDLCEVLLGILITVKIKHLSIGALASSIGSALAALLIMLLGTGLVAALASMALDLDLKGTLLSYSPGGIESVAIIALAAGLDAIFIVKMHLVRLVIVQVTPAVAARVRRGSVSD